MSYGALQEPGYEARLAEVRKVEQDRAAQAQQHIAALLRGAKAQEKAQADQDPILDRIASALERIAAAQERAFPDSPPVIETPPVVVEPPVEDPAITR